MVCAKHESDICERKFKEDQIRTKNKSIPV